MSRTIASAAVVTAISAVLSNGARAAVPVYGGPTYDPATQTGNPTGPGQWYFPTGIIAGDGYSVSAAGMVSSGTYLGGTSFFTTPTSTTPYALPAFAGTGTLSGSVVGRTAAGVAGGSEGRIDSKNQFLGGQALRWDAAGTPTALQDVSAGGSAHGSAARGINDAGTVVGYTTISTADSYGYLYTVDVHPIRWDAATTTATRLDVMGTDANGHTIGDTVGITAAGVTYGVCYKYVSGVNLGLRAVRWNAVGTALTELGTLGTASDGSTSAGVTAVNDAGVAVGGSQSYSNTGQSLGTRPVRWNADGSATALDVLADFSGSMTNNTASKAYAVNASGTAVGLVQSQASSFTGLRAARWDAGGSALTQLGLIGATTSDTSSFSHGINDAGVAVGTQRAHLSDSDGIALMWGTDGVAIDLNTLIDPASNWRLIEADAISNSGWVAGIGLYDPDGVGPQVAYYRNYLIQVPEPTSVCLAGLLGLSLLHRQRRR